MRTGVQAGHIHAAAGVWELVYTVPKGESGVVSLLICAEVNTTFAVRHVPTGNGGTTLAPSLVHDIFIGSLNGITIRLDDLGMGSLDDIWVTSNKSGILVINVNSKGEEFKGINRKV